MSEWFTYNEDDCDLDYESGEVDINFGYNNAGNMYLSILFADIEEIHDKIVEWKRAQELKGAK